MRDLEAAAKERETELQKSHYERETELTDKLKILEKAFVEGKAEEMQVPQPLAECQASLAHCTQIMENHISKMEEMK